MRKYFKFLEKRKQFWFKLTKMRTLFLVIILFTQLGCKKGEVEDEAYKVISFFVNNVIPFPLPVPKVNAKETHISQEVVDSIMKKHISIGVYYKMQRYKGEINFKKEDSTFLPLTNKLKELLNEKEIIFSRIKNNNNRKIIIYSKVKTDHKEYVDFDISLSFSRIVFNKKMDKSAVIVSEYRSSLAGTTALYYLIKNNNKWAVYKKRVLEVS